MSVHERLKIKRVQIDTWSVKEKLCLASSVLRSGDQNWMSVSRSLRAFGEPSRPPDWFSQKNCAVQYSNLLENVETPKRKKRSDKAEAHVETPGESIVRKLTQERIDELKRLLQEQRLEYLKLKDEVMQVKSGYSDDKLTDIFQEIDEEKKQKERDVEAHGQWLKEREEKKLELERAWKPPVAPASPHRRKIHRNLMRRNSSQSEPSSEADSALDSPLSEPLNIDVIGEDQQTEPQMEPRPPPPTPTSPLLTSLLKSPSPAPTSQASSILHSAITSHRGSTPTITSLLNSAPGIPGTSGSLQVAPPTTVSSSLKNLVSSAISGAAAEHHPTHATSPSAGSGEVCHPEHQEMRVRREIGTDEPVEVVELEGARPTSENQELVREEPIEVLIEEVVVNDDDTVIESDLLPMDIPRTSNIDHQGENVKLTEDKMNEKLDRKERVDDGKSRNRDIFQLGESLLDRTAMNMVQDDKVNKDIECSNKDIDIVLSSNEGDLPVVDAETVAEVIEIANEVQESNILTEVVESGGELADMEVIILDKVGEQVMEDVQIVEAMKDLECQVVEVVMGKTDEQEQKEKENQEVIDVSHKGMVGEQSILSDGCKLVQPAESEMTSVEQSIIRGIIESESIIETSKHDKKNIDIFKETSRKDNLKKEKASVDQPTRDTQKEKISIEGNKSSPKEKFGRENSKEDILSKDGIKKDKSSKEDIRKNIAEEHPPLTDDLKKGVFRESRREITKDITVKDSSKKDTTSAEASKKDLPLKGKEDSISNEQEKRLDKEIVKKDVSTKDVTKKDSSLKESIKKDGTSKEGMKRNLSSKDNTKKENSSKDTNKKDDIKKDLLSKDTSKKDLSSKENNHKKDGSSKKETSKEISKKDASIRDGAVKENSSKKDGSSRDSSRESHVKEGSHKKDASSKESASKKDNSSKDSISKKDQSSKEVNLRKEAHIKDNSKKDPSSKEGSRKDNVVKEIKKDAQKEESMLKESAKKEGHFKEDSKPVRELSRKDSLTKESTKKELRDDKKDIQKQSAKDVSRKDSKKEVSVKDKDNSSRDTKKEKMPEEVKKSSSKESSKKDSSKDLSVEENVKESAKKDISKKDKREDISKKDVLKRSLSKEDKKDSHSRDDVRKRASLKEGTKKDGLKKSEIESKTLEGPQCDGHFSKHSSGAASTEEGKSAVNDSKGVSSKMQAKKFDLEEGRNEAESVRRKPESADEENKSQGIDKHGEGESAQVIEDPKQQEASDSVYEKIDKLATSRSETPSTEDDKTNDAEPPRGFGKKRLGAGTPFDSIPNSPASVTDEEREYRAWKKAIMLVYGRLATHKFASLFLKPITDDHAPGYSSIVHKPIDLLTIKKNIETGVTRSTLEFQRDVMLMFQNAIMYNKSSHFVHRMVRQMHQEGMQHVQDFLTTQMLVQVVGEVPSRRETRTTEANKQRDMLANQDESDGPGSIKRKRTQGSESERSHKKKKAED